MLFRRKKMFLLLTVCVVPAMIIYGSYLRMLIKEASQVCSITASKKYLDSLCFNYSMKTVTGSLCKPLCVTKEVQLKRCLGHAVKLHVLEAEWNGLKVILKTSEYFGHEWTPEVLPRGVSEDDFKLTTAEFVKHAEMSIFDNHAEAELNLSLQLAQRIAKECDVGDDGVLSYRESDTCWQLVTNEEYIIYSLLHGNSAMLDVYGVCGSMYAVQHTASEPFLGMLPKILDSRPWEFRLKIALALLNMVEALEVTPYGTLYLCDVQESNFGTVEGNDGTLIAKAIDVDMATFEKPLLKQLYYESNVTSCTGHHDCDVVNCASRCDLKTRRCSGKLVSSNLMNICRNLLKPKQFLLTSVLSNPPTHAREKLERILDKCSYLGSPHNNRQLLRELKQLLHSLA